jgi:hypothetical protein
VKDTDVTLRIEEFGKKAPKSPMDDYLKIDLLGKWIERDWIARHTDSDLLTLWTAEATVNNNVLSKYEDDFELEDGYRFTSTRRYPCALIPRISQESHLEGIAYQSGAFVYTFTQCNTDHAVEVLVTAAFTSDDFYDNEIICLACMPEAFTEVWRSFVKECKRINWSLNPKQQVYIIGGRESSFVPSTDWDEIILPDGLKDSILNDVQVFFDKGIEVYKRLNLKPFRKMLLAGVPGTGKTMLCSALAKWAIDQKYLVIYVSSSDSDGATFRKIQRALDIAARSEHPTLLILEEFDAYLHDEEKALVLNVLDGSESNIHDLGTLLIATTNYPESIDERVLKRPGRLDRIFIIPEMEREEDAEKMLKNYLATMWRDEHRTIARQMVGYPGAFIREVAIYALTQVAQDDMDELPLAILEDSFASLRDQIRLRDDFLVRRGGLGYRPMSGLD